MQLLAERSPVRIVTRGFALTLGAMFLLSGCAAAPPPRQPAGNAEKVLICHKGRQTLEVGGKALQAHLKHGDQRGTCW